MSKIFLRISVVVVSLICLANLRAGEFTPRIYTGPDGKTLPYELRIPEGYDKTQKYSVVLYFHGAGERGTDNQRQLLNGMDVFCRAPKPGFVIAPQCPVDQQWVDMPWGAPSGVRPPQPSFAMAMALKILDQVTTEFDIDPDRVYVAGISMGGYAVWDCITRFPDRFAAGVLTCGGGDEKTVTPAVAQVPVWAFHSSDDPIVPVARDRNMIKAMTDAGGHPRYTEYNFCGHGCWFQAFATPDLIPWLFSADRAQRRKQ